MISPIFRLYLIAKQITQKSDSDGKFLQSMLPVSIQAMYMFLVLLIALLSSIPFSILKISEKRFLCQTDFQSKLMESWVFFLLLLVCPHNSLNCPDFDKKYEFSLFL